MTNLKKLRENKVLTLMQMAASLKLPYSTYRAYETGERSIEGMSLNVALRIRDILCCNIDDLIKLAESPEHLHTD